MKTDIPKGSHFSDFLKPTQIIFELKAKTKIQALEELLDVLQKKKLIKNKKPILTRIIDRERLDSTAIGHGVALPHARINTGGDITVAVGKSEKGIDFDAVDGKKVHIVILLVWNPAIPGLFNHLFAGLAKFLSEVGFRRRLFNAKNRTELYKILSEIVLRLPQPEDKIISRARLLLKLQRIEQQKAKAKKDKLKELKKQALFIREELDAALLDRFDRLMERYGFAVAELVDGACQGCYINVATGMSSAIEGSNDIYICENCGKFLVARKKK
ncbi:MAG: PTS sugar transporter subunit IIA [Candidatus Aminicenantes bacterium]|jgi:mannitol/fructose-specific phosphotransferase system IIA component (Ntr-type)